MGGIVISVVNNKGGVGKTTATVNLAEALARRNQRVLVIDMDTQCNATSLLLPTDVRIRNSLYELLDPEETEERNIEDFIHPTKLGNVFCIPNVSDTASLEPIMIHRALTQKNPEVFFKLRRMLRQHIQENFDFAIIDNPPNMGTFVLCSLYASDFIVVPVKAGSAFSVEGLIKAINLIDSVRDNGNKDLRFLRLLINKADRRTFISRANIEQIRQSFSEQRVFNTIVPVNTAFERAESQGSTIFQYDQTSSGARSYRELARELLAIFEKNGD